MSHPIDELEREVLVYLCEWRFSADADADVHRAFDAFRKKYRAVEVDASKDGAALLWDTYRTGDDRMNPQTIMVPADEPPSVVEVLREVVDAWDASLSKRVSLGRFYTAMDAARAALKLAQEDDDE